MSKNTHSESHDVKQLQTLARNLDEFFEKEKQLTQIAVVLQEVLSSSENFRSENFRLLPEQRSFLEQVNNHLKRISDGGSFWDRDYIEFNKEGKFWTNQDTSSFNASDLRSHLVNQFISIGTNLAKKSDDSIEKEKFVKRLSSIVWLSTYAERLSELILAIRKFPVSENTGIEKYSVNHFHKYRDQYHPEFFQYFPRIILLVREWQKVKLHDKNAENSIMHFLDSYHAITFNIKPDSPKNKTNTPTALRKILDYFKQPSQPPQSSLDTSFSNAIETSLDNSELIHNAELSMLETEVTSLKEENLMHQRNLDNYHRQLKLIQTEKEGLQTQLKKVVDESSKLQEEINKPHFPLQALEIKLLLLTQKYRERLSKKVGLTKEEKTRLENTREYLPEKEGESKKMRALKGKYRIVCDLQKCFDDTRVESKDRIKNFKEILQENQKTLSSHRDGCGARFLKICAHYLAQAALGIPALIHYAKTGRSLVFFNHSHGKRLVDNLKDELKGNSPLSRPFI